MAATATVEADGSAILSLDGIDHKIGGTSVDTTRLRIRELVTEYAAKTGQPQTLQAHDSTGTWQTIIHPDGRTEAVSSRADAGPSETLPAAEESAEPEIPRDTSFRRFKVTSRVVLSAAGGLLIACAVTAAVSITSNPAPATPPAATGTGPLWTIPENVTALAAAGLVVAGTSDGSLALYEGPTGKAIPMQGKVAVPDAGLVKAASGDGLTVISVSEASGVAVVQGTVHPYEGKGAVLDRGPVPVLVGGTAQAKTFWVFNDGAPVQVQPPERGNSLFGGLPGGGSIWAAAGGKVTYVPASGAPRTIPLLPPVPGATVSTWLSAGEATTTILWKAGNSHVLAEHDTSAEGKGEIKAKTALEDGDTVSTDSGLTVLHHKDGTSEAYPATAHDPRCADPVITSKTLWCPGPDSAWRSGTASVPGQPAAAGAGFALIFQDNHTQVLPTTQPTK
ncbi:hypothetical protein ACFUOZ_19600 [Paenarthrobacter sp. NPDC057355]|uniref:hypothetical protein n=1 Tax=Paenarthrobacter sp. NPDC057355 TaxID=3346105 RepID=UPI0036350786